MSDPQAPIRQPASDSSASTLQPNSPVIKVRRTFRRLKEEAQTTFEARVAELEESRQRYLAEIEQDNSDWTSQRQGEIQRTSEAVERARNVANAITLENARDELVDLLQLDTALREQHQQERVDHFDELITNAAVDFAEHSLALTRAAGVCYRRVDNAVYDRHLRDLECRFDSYLSDLVVARLKVSHDAIATRPGPTPVLTQRKFEAFCANHRDELNEWFGDNVNERAAGSKYLFSKLQRIAVSEDRTSSRKSVERIEQQMMRHLTSYVRLRDNRLLAAAGIDSVEQLLGQSAGTSEPGLDL